MIWSVVSKKEMEGFGTSPTFQFYREVIGDDNIKLAIVDEDNELDFVAPSDIVLLRTASKSLISTIKTKRIKSTAELYETYALASNKIAVGEYLNSKGVLAPKTYAIEEVVDGKMYFVKPKNGSDSKCITIHNICRTRADVKFQVMRLNALGYVSIVEDFMSGSEYSVACVDIGGNLLTYAVEVVSDTDGIQTGKSICFCKRVNSLIGLELRKTASSVFKALNLKSHARIDFRSDENGNIYVIDVNLIPNIGPQNMMPRCMLLSKNVSYSDAIEQIIQSAK